MNNLWDTTLDTSLPRICEDCGEEVDCGLMATMEHDAKCKCNAPNMNIGHYHRSIRKKMVCDHQKMEWNSLLSKMNKDEYNEYLRFLSSGIPLGNNTLGYGGKMMDKINVFKRKLMVKYKEVKN